MSKNDPVTRPKEKSALLVSGKTSRSSIRNSLPYFKPKESDNAVFRHTYHDVWDPRQRIRKLLCERSNGRFHKWIEDDLSPYFKRSATKVKSLTELEQNLSGYVDDVKIARVGCLKSHAVSNSSVHANNTDSLFMKSFYSSLSEYHRSDEPPDGSDNFHSKEHISFSFTNGLTASNSRKLINSMTGELELHADSTIGSILNHYDHSCQSSQSVKSDASSISIGSSSSLSRSHEQIRFRTSLVDNLTSSKNVNLSFRRFPLLKHADPGYAGTPPCDPLPIPGEHIMDTSRHIQAQLPNISDLPSYSSSYEDTKNLLMIVEPTEPHYQDDSVFHSGNSLYENYSTISRATKNGRQRFVRTSPNYRLLTLSNSDAHSKKMIDSRDENHSTIPDNHTNEIQHNHNFAMKHMGTRRVENYGHRDEWNYRAFVGSEPDCIDTDHIRYFSTNHLSTDSSYTNPNDENDNKEHDWVTIVEPSLPSLGRELSTSSEHINYGKTTELSDKPYQLMSHLQLPLSVPQIPEPYKMSNISIKHKECISARSQHNTQGMLLKEEFDRKSLVLQERSSREQPASQVYLRMPTNQNDDMLLTEGLSLSSEPNDAIEYDSEFCCAIDYQFLHNNRKGNSLFWDMSDTPLNATSVPGYPSHIHKYARSGHPFMSSISSSSIPLQEQGAHERKLSCTNVYVNNDSNHRSREKSGVSNTTAVHDRQNPSTLNQSFYESANPQLDLDKNRMEERNQRHTNPQGRMKIVDQSLSKNTKRKHNRASVRSQKNLLSFAFSSNGLRSPALTQSSYSRLNPPQPTEHSQSPPRLKRHTLQSTTKSNRKLKNRLSWLLFGACCTFPPALVCFGVGWMDPIIISLSHGQVEAAGKAQKQVALILGCSVCTIGVVIVITVVTMMHIYES